MIKAILAADANWGIGRNNSLPWPKNKDDLKWFREMTIGYPVVMGYNTWISDMPKPLPRRINCVVSSKDKSEFDIQPHCIIHPNNLVNTLHGLEEKFIDVWVIGGAFLIHKCLELDVIDQFHINRFTESYDCDTVLDIETIRKKFESDFGYGKIEANRKSKSSVSN